MGSFGIVLFNAETVEAAREIMLNDPAVKNKVFRAEQFSYKMSLFGPDNAKSAYENIALTASAATRGSNVATFLFFSMRVIISP
jgi:hypothetical protein